MGGSKSDHSKPHVVCIPLPVQSHIKAMLKFARLLHHKGFHITFVNTDFNHKRFLKSLGLDSLDGSPDFHFETIPDGLQNSDEDTAQDHILLGDSIRNKLLAPFLDLITKLNISTNNPPVSRVVSDGFMSFTLTAAEETRIPTVLFFSFSASSIMGYMQFPILVQKGLAPLKGTDIPS